MVVNPFFLNTVITDDHLKVHQVEEFVDLRRQNFHRLFIDVHPIRLLVRLNTNNKYGS
jgi:hypothetical protein